MEATLSCQGVAVSHEQGSCKKGAGALGKEEHRVLTMGVPGDCIEVQPVSAGVVTGEENLLQHLIFSKD